jgi:fatty acid desaturase
MRKKRIELRPYLVVLIVCTAALVGLVHAEGWIWPLKAAAVMIPVSILVG